MTKSLYLCAAVDTTRQDQPPHARSTSSSTHVRGSPSGPPAARARPRRGPPARPPPPSSRHRRPNTPGLLTPPRETPPGVSSVVCLGVFFSQMYGRGVVRTVRFVVDLRKPGYSTYTYKHTYQPTYTASINTPSPRAAPPSRLSGPGAPPAAQPPARPPSSSSEPWPLPFPPPPPPSALPRQGPWGTAERGRRCPWRGRRGGRADRAARPRGGSGPRQ